MKTRTLINAIASLAIMTFFGCGGGGGTTAAPTPAPPAGSVSLTGIAAKGPISNGDVRVLALKADGTPDTANPIATGKTATDGSGKYTVVIAPANADKALQPLVIEVTNGSYTDEATGVPVTLNTTTKLRAIVPKAVDGDKIAVTPLTELAYKKAEGTGAGKFIATNIDDANTSIGTTFNVANIITNQPFDPTRPAPAGVSPDDKKYAGALGVFSQMIQDDKVKNNSASLAAALDDVLNQMETEVSKNAGFSPTVLSMINTAVTNFNTAHPNQTGTAMTKVVFKSGVLTVTTASNPPLATGSAINGLDFTVTMPAGVIVKTKDAVSGEAADGVVLLSSAAAALQNTLTTARFDKVANTLHVVILNVQPGFAAGEFAHINFDVDIANGGAFPTDPAAFSITINQASGGADPKNATTLSGITATNVFAGF